jgi:VWFA-related protein
MRLIKILVVPFAVAAAVLAQVMPAQEKESTPAQRAPEHTVSVLFTATDGHGIPLREVTTGSVSVSENNQALQTVQVQDASDVPLDLGIVLLASKQKFEQEQAAAIDLAKRVMKPGRDKVFVVTASGDKPWTTSNIPWLTDPAAVVGLVRGLDKNTGLPDLFIFNIATNEVGVQRSNIQTYSMGTGFSAFDVIWAMMKNDPRPARRAVVIFRLPSAHSPGFGEKVTRASEDTHNRVITVAQSLGISFFTIGLEDTLPQSETTRANIQRDYMPTHEGNSVSTREYDAKLDRAKELQYTAGRQNVERIADETGGRPLWSNRKNFSDAIEDIASELSARYIVSFVPADKSAASPVHRIKVQVAGAAHVSAPRAYIVQSKN